MPYDPRAEFTGRVAQPPATHPAVWATLCAMCIVLLGMLVIAVVRFSHRPSGNVVMAQSPEAATSLPATAKTPLPTPPPVVYSPAVTGIPDGRSPVGITPDQSSNIAAPEPRPSVLLSPQPTGVRDESVTGPRPIRLPKAPPAGDLPLPHGWVERPIAGEIPLIRIVDRTGSPTYLTLTNGPIHLRWTINGQLQENLPAGEWQYAIYTPGRPDPDVEGVLRCRRHREYDLFIEWNIGGPARQDLGDVRQRA